MWRGFFFFFFTVEDAGVFIVRLKWVTEVTAFTTWWSAPFIWNKSKNQHWRDWQIPVCVFTCGSIFHMLLNTCLCLVFTWRGQQVVDVDGFRAVGSSEKLLLQPLPQSRVGLDAPLQLQPQVSDLWQQLTQVHRARWGGRNRLPGCLTGFCSEVR